MSAAHTPGPWVVHPLRLNQVCTADGLEVACATILHPAKVTVDNARLIAAAPELLEALRMMTAHYANLVRSGDAGSWEPDAEPEVQMARAAIAKATGGAQ